MPARRFFLIFTGAAFAMFLLGGPAWAQEAGRLRFGKAIPFSFAALTGEARTLAKHPFVPDATVPAGVLDRIDYEALGKVRFRTDCALFRNGPGQYPATFFLPGRFSRTPVRIYVLDGPPGARAREIIYDASYFDMPADSPARSLPVGAGFGGFRFQESRFGGPHAPDWRKNDWVAFQGASYFRAIGELYQYGLSARGLAIDTVQSGHPEEFPAFTRFYLEPHGNSDDAVTAYALLEGSSVTGAYRFVMRRSEAVRMDVEARIFLRRDVARLGMAPLTSMYWFSETEKPTAVDWRPDVHDSDGLAIWTGNGERIWRPLNDPPDIAVSAFADDGPRGFGLLQRDRLFDHYLDGVHYERRPSLWVEPLGNWGDGAVQLVEIPTDDEIHDNIVAFWVPKAPAAAGSSYDLRYRLHWTAAEPFPPSVAACIATRIGRGGEPGKPRPRGVQKFVVEFLGAPLASLPFGVVPEPVLSASGGHFSCVFVEAVPDGVPGHWRAQFDFTPAGPATIDMRLYLKVGSRALTETWLYQYHSTEAARK